MYNLEKHSFKKFENKIWLSSPTVYQESMDYVQEAYETNWMSTVGENINVVENYVQKKQDVNMVLHYLVVLLLYIWL